MISVCMATYNGERFLREQIESILAQLGECDELIISDDGSTDNTLEIITSFDDDRIKLFHNEGNSGVNHNFENALKHTMGDMIFFSDQDDIWIDGKVKACVEALKECDCVFHDGITINGEGEVIANSFYINKIPSGNFLKNLWKTSYMSCRMAINRRTLKYVLPYPSDLKCYQEGWVASIIAIKSNVKFITFKGIQYRRHGCNASCTSSKSPYSLKEKFLIRLNLLTNVIKRLLK